MGFLKEYKKVVRYSGLKLEPNILLTIGGVIVLLSLLTTIVLADPIYLVVGLVLSDIVAMGPYFLGKKKIDEIEANLSEALRQMAAVLRSGGTFEVAVREIALSDYGQLSKEFARILREMEGGKSFVAALQGLSLRITSPILDKVTIIISDAIRTGGRVADILDEIAEDIRAHYHTRRERRAKTTMQFFFLLAAAAILGPFLMGVTLGIIDFMTNLGSTIAATGAVKTLTPESVLQKKAVMQVVDLILTIFVILEAALSAFLSAAMREGKTVYGIIYAPFYILLAYLFLMAGRFVVHILTMG